MSTIPTDSAPGDEHPGLRQELAAIEAHAPGWHLWIDTGGRINATHAYSLAERRLAAPASGITLDEGSPEMIWHAIGEQQHEWACALRQAGRAA